MRQKVCHIISHSHWDREWYMPYEKHHVRLVKLMDTLLDVLDRDPDFKSFHLDGQTIVLEDYFQVRPEMKEKVAQYIKEGRLHIGPWYILQDEFLTSSEANIRNLLVGLRDAQPYGSYSKVGYFPDSFGNMGQAPQILRQAGIDTAVFGRGVKPIGPDNEVKELDGYESPYSELDWRSPDGSSVVGILFANWYHNGMEIPVNEEEAQQYWQGRMAAVERFASTNHLLFMNGCDHQPVQTNLSEALSTARKILPDVQFIHSSFDEYIEQVKQNLPSDLAVVQGELRSQKTDGWTTLVNTASARIYLKQMNQRCQSMLENVAEPLAALAATLGTPYPHHLFTYSWKTLMQNHPHDSICGCSVDEVHREMVTRFDKSYHVAEEIVDESLKAIGQQIDTSVFAQSADEAIPFTVYNSTGWERTGVVSVELEVKRLPLGAKAPSQLAADLEEFSIDGWGLVDHQGQKIDSTVEDLGAVFGYDLPEDRFRQPYMARRLKLTFEAEQVPALGYKTYAWSKDALTTGGSTSSLVVGNQTMENEHVKAVIAEDGTLTVTEKQSGHSFTGLCAYEDVGDIGNEYMFKQPEGEQAITTHGLKADISLVEDSSYRATYEIIHHWDIPAKGDELLDKEIRQMVPFTQRKAQRVQETIPMTIATRVSLEKGSRALRVTTSFNNQATDHRLRVLFPTDLEASTHAVDSIFEVAKRNIQPAAEWQNPSNTQHQQAFVSVNNEQAGLTIANLGLNEYEVLRDGRNSIAVTILRSVAELGDWGVFLTPEAQCLGEQSVEFEIIPHAGDGVESGAFVESYQYQVPWSVQQVGIHEGSLPAEYGLISWEGKALALSSVKISEESEDLILRWFNMGLENSTLGLKSHTDVLEVYKSNILEERLNHEVFEGKEDVRFDITPAEIITLGLKRK